MRSSVDHILTSHAGSLPRPDDLIEAWGGNDEHALATKLTASVADVVRRQREVGIDVPDDTKPPRHGPRQCNTVADPSRRNWGAGAGKIGGDVFEPGRDDTPLRMTN